MLSTVELFADKLMCIDDDIVIFGAYESERVSHLSISYTKCANSTESDIICASEDEIMAYMRGNFIMTLSNQEWF